MNVRTLLHAALTAGAITAAGCSLQYNGAWGASRRDTGWGPATPKPAPTAARPAPALGANAAALPASPTTTQDAPRPVRFDTAPQDPGVSALFAATDPVAFTPAAEPVRVAAAAIRPLGLYGQLPPQGDGRSGGDHAPLTSPLDSPDNVRRVTFAPEGADFDPAVDPTGEWIVYASTQHRQTADLYFKKVNGTAVTQLTADPGNDVMPAISRDGKRVAFASDRSGNWDIYLMDLAGGGAGGGQAVQLTNDATHEIHPSFSPNGKRLVYCSYGAQSGQWELVVIDVDRPGVKRFIGYGLFPQWSPASAPGSEVAPASGGDRIVFQKSRERGTRWFSIWTIDLVDGEGVRPTEIVASPNAAVITPSWSPDGNHITFCTVPDPMADESTRPRQADVWVIGADGSGRVNLTNSQFANLQPIWARDGSIYFVSSRGKDGREKIWSVRPDRALLLAQGEAKAGSNTLTVPTPAAPPAGPVEVHPSIQPVPAHETPAPAPALSAAKPADTMTLSVPPATPTPAPERAAVAPTDE